MRALLCSHAGCSNLQPCPTHKRRTAARPARGYGRTWRKVRDPYIAAHPRCQDCGQPSEIADHLDGKGPLGPNGHQWWNLEPVCWPCHSRRTIRHDGGYGTAPIPRLSVRSRCQMHPECVGNPQKVLESNR